MFFQVKLGVVRQDVDTSLHASSDSLAVREALLRAQLQNIQNLTVDVPPGFLAPSRTQAAPAPPAHDPSVADEEEDDDDDEDEDDEDDDALDEEDESADESADGSG
jgi:ribosomal protein L12E/L44/L45/RPP1/RPP2